MYIISYQKINKKNQVHLCLNWDGFFYYGANLAGSRNSYGLSKHDFINPSQFSGFSYFFSAIFHKTETGIF